MKKIIAVVVACLSMSSIAHAELVQQFKDPTFSGIGWASHVLTVEQMRQSAQNAKDSKAASEKASIDAAAANTPLAKFMALFTGQVYSQLATQLTNNLFKECVSADPSRCANGEFNVTETQKIVWSKNTNTNVVTLSVYDGTKNNDNSVTWNSAFTQQIVVPISQFSF